jgi:hypothetical protein
MDSRDRALADIVWGQNRTMKTTEELITELVDRAIRDLPVRYCDCMW